MAIDTEGSFVTENGAIRHFSRQAFVGLASNTGRCFICGIDRSIAQFDDEHVVPDWLLRRFNLHSRMATLPNGHSVMYGRYTLRCCRSCNDLLGRAIEDPISRLFVEDAKTTVRNLESARTLLYKWLCLLFIKIHLKDRDIRFDPDERNESIRIGEIYDWDGLHHIHSVARAAHSLAHIDEGVPGTTFAFEMKPGAEMFDFGTLSDYSAMMIRIGSVGIAAVLNDCGQVRPMVADYLSGISGPLSSIQLREVAARLAYGNKLIVNSPQFWSEIEGTDSLAIRSRAPYPGPHHPTDREELGDIIAFSCGPPLLNSDTPSAGELMGKLKRGEISFLYHDDGSFIQ